MFINKIEENQPVNTESFKEINSCALAGRLTDMKRIQKEIKGKRTTYIEIKDNGYI